MMDEFTLYTQKFIKHCRNQRRLSPDTVKAYGLDLKGFTEFIAGLFPPVPNYTDVTKQTLQDYANYLNENFAVKTVRRKIATLRSFYNYLEYDEIISENPFNKFHLNIKEPFRIPKTMSLEEVDRILKTVYGDAPSYFPSMKKIQAKKSKASKGFVVNTNSKEFIWVRDVTILEMLFAGGFRVSELCKLEFGDISADHSAIRINGKGNKERTIYLENFEVIKAFNQYLAYRQAAEIDNSFIFITRFHEPLSTQAVRNLVKKYTEMAGIHKNITPHIFRHSFASLLLEEGVDIKYIQDFLGHSSISTTQIYLHTTSSQKRKIMSSKHPRQKLDLSDASPKIDAVLAGKMTYGR